MAPRHEDDAADAARRAATPRLGGSAPEGPGVRSEQEQEQSGTDFDVEPGAGLFQNQHQQHNNSSLPSRPSREAPRHWIDSPVSTLDRDRPGRLSRDSLSRSTMAMSKAESQERIAGQHATRNTGERSSRRDARPSPSSFTNEMKDFVRNDIRGSIKKALGKDKEKKKRPGQMSLRDRVGDQAAVFRQKVLIEGILRRKPLPPSADGRHIPLNPTEVGPEGLIDERSQKPYVSNFIRSSRYTAYDFLPKQLIFQFSRLGNFYFLVVGILQMIPGLSTVGRWTTIAPLAVFVTLSMLKEGYDDYRRYLLDRGENRSLISVMDQGIRLGHEPPKLKKDRKPPLQLLFHLARLQVDKSYKQAELRKQHRARQAAREAEEARLASSKEGWLRIQWEDVQVGDVVRVQRNQSMPADMVLLYATGPGGVAYIDTMALDGETNLKSKQASPLFKDRCASREGLRSTRATIVSEDPNLDLYTYDGRATVGDETLPLSTNNVVFRGSTLRNTSEAIGIVINTGEECKIRMNANKHVAAKKPAMQSIINKMILLQIGVLLLLSMGLTIGYHLWKNSTEEKSFYIVEPGVYNATVPYGQIFIGFILMFNTLIPISLYISLEIIKVGQLLLLGDVDMYDPVTDTPMRPNTSTILENLGQVTHIFSDKTGTMTENIMRFRKMTVGGIAFLHDMDEMAEQECPLKRKTTSSGDTMSPPSEDVLKRPAPERIPSTWSLSRWWSPSTREAVHEEMKTEELLEYMQHSPDTDFSKRARQFLLCIALCHTCLPEVKENGDIGFQAASPDELALVEAARDLGLLLTDRVAQSITLSVQNADGTSRNEMYQVLDVIEFSSKRKRMSVIVQMPDGRICVISKGADNVIMSRLRLCDLARQKAHDIGRRASQRKTMEQGEEIQRRGSQVIGSPTSPRSSLSLKRNDSSTRPEDLRVSLGRRSADINRLSQAEGFQSWLNRRSLGAPLSVAEGQKSRIGMPQNAPRGSVEESIGKLAAKDDGQIFESCFKHINDFASDGLRTLVYAHRYIDREAYDQWKQVYREAETSLVDRQERIEEAAELIEKDYELTGATAIEDKLQEGVPETIDKLRRANIKIWMLTGDKRETAINIGHSARLCKGVSEVYILDAAAPEGDLHDKMKDIQASLGDGTVPHSVMVVDGHTLSTIDGDEDLAVLFYDLAILVDSVICCRASPAQKAHLVRSIRRYVPKSMALAIGDGANDIGMIQASHVGVGISGREGLQASRISDFSIAQFRFLQKLLLAHGRWNYLRTGKYILATFWKEMFFYLVQAHFQRLNGYTGTSLYQSWSLTVFNALFTSLPVIFLGIAEKDLSAETLLAVPELYTFGQRNRGFNFMQYFWWVLQAVVSSVIVFYFTWAVYDVALWTSVNDLYAVGVVCFTVGVIFINIKILILETHHKTVIIFTGFFLSLLAWFLWLLALDGIFPQELALYNIRDTFTAGFGRQLIWWATILLELGALVVIELVVQALRRVYRPTDVDLFQRIEKDEAARRSLLDRAAAAERGDVDGVELQELGIVNGRSRRRQGGGSGNA